MNSSKVDEADMEFDRILNPIKIKSNLHTFRISPEAFESIESESYYFDKTKSQIVRERVVRYLKTSLGRMSEEEIEARLAVNEAMFMAKSIPGIGFLITSIDALEYKIKLNPNPTLLSILNIYKKELEWRKLQPPKFDAEAAAEAAADRERLNRFMHDLRLVKQKV